MSLTQALPATRELTPDGGGRTAAADATTRLYERHHLRILAYCVNQLRDRQEAEDAVQNTFVYAFKLLEQGVVPNAELPWLFTIAHNACRSRRRTLRRRGRVETTADLDALQDVISTPANAAADDLAGLSDALASMPETQRRALLLREWRGLSYAEIGASLSLSQSAVETLLFRARRNLAKQLATTYDRVAVMLNGFVLLRFVRRFAQTSTGTKATALALTAGIVAGGAIPLEHARRAQQVPPIPKTSVTSAVPRPQQTALTEAPLPVRKPTPADRGHTRTPQPTTLDVSKREATGAAPPAAEPAPSPVEPSQPPAPSTTGPNGAAQGSAAPQRAPVQALAVVPPPPLDQAINQLTSDVSPAISNVVSQAAAAVDQTASATSGVASSVGAPPTTGGTPTATASPPAPVQQTATDVATAVAKTASQLPGQRP
ncbi:MAG TPA: sigma-70 family RNA polymerase sigma factor [Gaiellaceae bacterium]|nr:sigma-70 family RNA polymerase sigma factor [Gaiellaceae bacterium]